MPDQLGRNHPAVRADPVGERPQPGWLGHADRSQYGNHGIVTQLVATMAFRTQAPVVLDLIFTLTSLVLAIVVATLGLALAATRRRWAHAAGGGIIGGAISMIQYLGMSAYRLSRRGMWRALASTLAASVGAGLWWDHRNARLQDPGHSCGATANPFALMDGSCALPAF